MGTILFLGFCAILLVGVVIFMFSRRNKTRDKNLPKGSIPADKGTKDFYE